MTITPASVTPGSTVVFLSRREQEVLRLVCVGKSNKAIAAALGLALGTVKQYLRSLYSGLKLTGKLELALWAHQYPDALAAPHAAPHAFPCDCRAIECWAMRAGLEVRQNIAQVAELEEAGLRLAA